MVHAGVVLASRIPPSPAGSFRAAPTALNREGADMPATSATASSGTLATGPTEEVIRPTGLRHGRWEAPQWAFWTAGAVIIVFALFYALVRLGTIDSSRFRRKKT